jgi:hypothetical protein
MNNFIKSICAIILTPSFLVAACGHKEPEVEVFTLYRNVPSDQTFRVHVATFDASGPDGRGSEFDNFSNFKNCERAQQMFQAQPDWNNVKFWCEKGRFKK